MRAWLLVLGLVFAGCFDDINADLNANVDLDGDGEPDEPVTVRPAAEEPGKVAAVADAEPDDGSAVAEADAGQDAGPLALFDTTCTGQDAECGALADGFTCWQKHSAPGQFPHDMFAHCTFGCTEPVEVERPDGSRELVYREIPERVDACWAMGGACASLSDTGNTYCAPAAN